MKIGIMGGTFNPIHNAHLMMAQAAYEQYKLDEIWFMPSAKPPHKNQDEIAEKEHRKRMVQFAIDKIPHFKISNIEYKVMYDDKFFEHLHTKRLVVDDKILFPMSTFERMIRYIKYGYMPCRETKLKIATAIHETNIEDISVSKSLYEGMD